MRIALLEDEQHIAELVGLWLEEEGHRVNHFASGTSLIDALRRNTFDLLILDWLVPDVDGEAVLGWVRGHLDWHIPVLFVTQRDAEDDVVRILMQGADDYLSKPVRPRELIARVTALARRSTMQRRPSQPLQHEPYQIDLATRTVTRDDETIQLTQKEFELAAFLFQNAGRVLSRDYILENVWGHRPGMNTRTVDTHISRLRSKLRLYPENGWKLTGIYHHGYRLEPATAHVPPGTPTD